MNDSSNICLSCGLCCDGTLIGFVQLETEEIPTLGELMGDELVTQSGVFLQPCTKYCDGCTIYANRPKQCANFKCGLLNSVEQKKLDFDKAVEAIAELKKQKNILENCLAEIDFKLKSKSFYFKMIELKNYLDKYDSLSSGELNIQKLMVELEVFEALLKSKFKLELN